MIGVKWRQAEPYPNFITEIDGLDIHFIHVRSKHENALPLIITHGWPGSIIEQLKIIGPLTNPTAYGGKAEDAFDVVIPSMPGYGFSGRPTTTGWGPARIAYAWVTLMKRLGYKKFFAQGGDWGGLSHGYNGCSHPKIYWAWLQISLARFQLKSTMRLLQERLHQTASQLRKNTRTTN